MTIQAVYEKLHRSEMDCHLLFVAICVGSHERNFVRFIEVRAETDSSMRE